MNFVNLFLLISSFQGVILGLLIFFSPFFKSSTNNYLGYSIGILSLLMFNIFLSNIRVFDTYPKLNILNEIEWVFLFPVFFFFYILRVLNHDLAKNKTLKWLYLPIVLSTIINVIVNLERDYSLYKIMFEGKESLYNLVIDIEEKYSYIFNVTLSVWSYRLIEKSLNNESLNIRWVKKLWLFVFFMIISWIILAFIEDIILKSYPQLDNYIIADLYILAIELSFFVYWVAYTGFYKLKIANERKEILDILNKKPVTTKGSQKGNFEKHKRSMPVSSSNFLENNSYFLKLEQLLLEQFIYRDPDLSREVVAEKLGISSGYLSQIVNTITQKNFTAYINSYRIEEAKRMILNEHFDKYSLLAIGLESGFKSKTTFYNSFKKETGCTPSEFKKKHK